MSHGCVNSSFSERKESPRRTLKNLMAGNPVGNDWIYGCLALPKRKLYRDSVGNGGEVRLRKIVCVGYIR